MCDPLKCQTYQNRHSKRSPEYPLKAPSVGGVSIGQGLHSAWGNRIPSLDLPASGNCQQSPSELWLSTETLPRLPRKGSWGLALLVPSQEALKCHLNSSNVSSWFSDLSSPSPQVASKKKKKSSDLKMSGGWSWFLASLLPCFGQSGSDFATWIIPALRVRERKPEFSKL